MEEESLDDSENIQELFVGAPRPSTDGSKLCNISSTVTSSEVLCVCSHLPWDIRRAEGYLAQVAHQLESPSCTYVEKQCRRWR